MKKIFSILCLLLMCNTMVFALRGGVKIAEMSNGEVSYSIEGTTVTLTATPADGYYLSDISAVKTVNPSAASRTRGEEIAVGSSYSLTKTSESADRSQVATYTFSLEAGYGVYVTATFAGRTAITADMVSLSATSFEYDGTEHKPTVAVTGLTENKDYTVTYAGTAWTNAATYTVTVAGIDTYKDSQSKTFTITRKGVTVTADDKTKVYGADDPELTATVAGTVGEDKVTYTLTRAEGEAVGEYAITAAGDAEQGNYAVTYAAGKFTITAADGAMTAPTAITGLVYNGKAQDLIVAGSSATGTIQYSLDGENYGETIPQGTDAKEYTIYYKVAADANHKDVAAVSIKATIARKAVTVTADDKTKVYGAANPELTATVAGTIGEDKVTYTLTRAEGEAVGEYAITASGDAEQGNYSVTYTTGKFTITKSEVIDEEHSETIDGETFYEPTEETKEAMKDHFDTDMEMTADAANHMHMNENHEMEFSEGEDVDVVLKDEHKGDIITINFTGHVFVHAGVLRQKGTAATRSTRNDDDMELISGTEYEVLEDGDIILIVGARDGAVILKAITNTHADNNTTAIDAVENGQSTVDTWYDLNGHRLQSKPTKKGLYIHNGKKFVVK